MLEFAQIGSIRSLILLKKRWVCVWCLIHDLVVREAFVTVRTCSFWFNLVLVGMGSVVPLRAFVSDLGL